MNEQLQIGELEIAVTRKAIKNVHLSVHPPDGRVTVSIPMNSRLEVVRAYAISKLAWIRAQQEAMRQQARETQREWVNRESHYLWGRRYLLEVLPTEGKQQVTLDHKHIRLYIKAEAPREKREALFYEWQKKQLHAFAKETIAKWEPMLNVQAKAYFLQKMKTQWGSCNHAAGTIRLNTELVKKPKDLVEYVIVHELAHLLVPKHNDAFVAILDQHYPNWREARAELNALPLGYVEWER